MEWIVAILLVLTGWWKYLLGLAAILFVLFMCGVSTGFFHYILLLIAVAIASFIIFSLIDKYTYK